MFAKINLKDLSKDELIDLILKNEKRLEKKDKEIESLKKELRKYKNENTPPSAHKHLMLNTFGQKSKKGAKRGAPKGHKGTTRYQKPNLSEIIDAFECPKCHSPNLKDKKIINQTVEEMPQPVTPETKESEIHLKECEDCGHVFVPPHNTTPLKGKFGINLIIMIIFIKFLLRGVLRKTASFLETGFAFKITPASVNSIIKRVADAAEKEYEDLKIRIRNAGLVYVDETSFSVLGKNQWVWVFRTANDILLVIRPSRGSKVLEEILGIEYSGTVICDCWRAYDYLTNANLQRCWSHLLRKSKLLCEYVAGQNFHDVLKKLFAEIERFNASNPTQEERLVKYVSMTKQLEKIIKYYTKYEEFTSVVKYINFHLGSWFTCVKISGIEPTNNFAEQAIRETVMVRKIIGAFRSETGKQNYETLASLIASWQMKKSDIKAELRRMLVKNLCFC